MLLPKRGSILTDVEITGICEVLHRDLHNYGWNGSVYGGIQHTLPWKIRLSLNGGGSTPYISLQGKGSGYNYYGLGLSRSFLKEERLSLNIYCNNFVEKYRTYNSHTEGQQLYVEKFEQISEPVLWI